VWPGSRVLPLGEPLQSLQVPAPCSVLGVGSTAYQLRRSVCSRRRQLSVPRCFTPPAGYRRPAKESLRRGLTHLQAAEFLYETHLFPSALTPSSTRSPTSGLWSLLRERRRPPRRIVKPSRSVSARLRAGRTAAYHALWERCGEGPHYSRQAGTRRARALPTGRPSRASSRRWSPDASPETGTPVSKPSISGSTFAVRSIHSEKSHGSTTSA